MAMCPNCHWKIDPNNPPAFTGFEYGSTGFEYGCTGMAVYGYLQISLKFWRNSAQQELGNTSQNSTRRQDQHIQCKPVLKLFYIPSRSVWLVNLELSSRQNKHFFYHFKRCLKCDVDCFLSNTSSHMNTSWQIPQKSPILRTVNSVQLVMH